MTALEMPKPGTKYEFGAAMLKMRAYWRAAGLMKDDQVLVW